MLTEQEVTHLKKCKAELDKLNPVIEEKSKIAREIKTSLMAVDDKEKKEELKKEWDKLDSVRNSLKSDRYALLADINALNSRAAPEQRIEI